MQISKKFVVEFVKKDEHLFSSSLKCLIAQIKLYKIRSICKNQGGPLPPMPKSIKLMLRTIFVTIKPKELISHYKKQLISKLFPPFYGKIQD